MREILFRAKSIADGEWVYGGLTSHNHEEDGKYKIVSIDSDEDTDLNCFINVDENTIGQFIGLTDKKGKYIFEGDINHDGSVLLWSEELVLFCFHRYNNGKWIRSIYPISPNDKIEIIGNIHDKE